VGVRAAAAALGLDFLPLVWEEYDIVLPGEALAAAASLIDALLDPGLRASIEGLGGYDASGAGEVRSLPDPDSPGADAQPTRSA
ncbi:MAG: substrate-binding domain-containing protein, partial [Solirubrobacteraceae bacterium]